MSASALPILLRALRLPTIAREHDDATRRAEAENWGYARFLSYLFEAEANERLQRKIQRQLKESNLPAGKTIESLDEQKLPDKIRRQLPTLLEADFVRRGDNLLCFGLAGRGKTHLVAAIAREWICRHQLQVLFVPAFRLVTQLLAAKRDLKLPQAIARLQRFDAVVIDDIGYVQQSREEMEVLFHFLAERYIHPEVEFLLRLGHVAEMIPRPNSEHREPHVRNDRQHEEQHQPPALWLAVSDRRAHRWLTDFLERPEPAAALGRGRPRQGLERLRA